jgi:hypothetical protein
MRTPPALANAPLDEVLDQARRLVVRQARDWAELVVDVEAPSRFMLLTEDGRVAGLAVERDGGSEAIFRWFLGARRPFVVGIFSPTDRSPSLVVRRPWTWLFSRVEVEDGAGRPLGTVRERFTPFRRTFDVEAPDGRLLARIVGPFFRPWTFLIRSAAGTRELGRIEKRWAGLLTEALTDADTFLVTLPLSDPALRRLTVGAAVLIDYRFFEGRD